jgi:hypothetical protein
MSFELLLDAVIQAGFDDKRTLIVRLFCSTEQKLNLLQVTNLLSKFSYDKGREDALKEVVLKTDIQYESSDYAALLNVFSFDAGRLSALGHLSKRVTIPFGQDIMDSFLFDKSRKEALNYMNVSDEEKKTWLNEKKQKTSSFGGGTIIHVDECGEVNIGGEANSSDEDVFGSGNNVMSINGVSIVTNCNGNSSVVYSNGVLYVNGKRVDKR